MLDLAKFEKVKEGKDTTTMRHKDGHEMTILHSKLPKIHREQLKRLKFADGGLSSPEAKGQGTGDQPSDASGGTTINIGTPSQVSPQQPMAGTVPVTQNPAANLGQAQVSPKVPSVMGESPNLNPDGTMNPSAVAQNTQTAAKLQGDINAAKSQAMSGEEQNYINQAAKTAEIDQKNLNDLKGHLDSFNQYAQDNPINPTHYQESLGAGRKVTNALGLLLGGFSGGFSGTGNNPALNFINDQISRDIQAQKSRMDQQQTIYGAYHQLYGDSVAANAATKASMLDIYSHQANKIASDLGTAQAKANSMAFSANAAHEKSKLLQEAAVDLRNLPGYNGQPSPQQGSGSNKPSPEMQKKESGTPSDKDYMEKDGYRTYPILRPGALEASKGLTHLAYLNQPKLQAQYTAADQVDKVLNGPNRDGIGGIHDLLSDMYQDIGKGKYIPAAATQLGMGASKVPYVGESLEGGMNLLGMQGYNDFMRKRTNMVNDLSTALQGLVAPTDIIRLVDENLPRGGDTPESVEESERQLVNGIKKSIKTDELERAGLVPKKAK